MKTKANKPKKSKKEPTYWQRLFKSLYRREKLQKGAWPKAKLVLQSDKHKPAKITHLLKKGAHLLYKALVNIWAPPLAIQNYQ